MTSIQLYCPVCSLEAKRYLLAQVGCRGVWETACEPASCPAGHGFMIRRDGTVQELIDGEWVVTGHSNATFGKGSGYSQGFARAVDQLAKVLDVGPGAWNWNQLLLEVNELKRFRDQHTRQDLKRPR